MKKLMALFVTLSLLLGIFNALWIVNAEGGYGDAYGSVEDSIEDIMLTSKEYPVKSGVIYAYPGITAGEMLATFQDNGDVVMYSNGEVVDHSAIVFTGYTIYLSVDDVAVDTAKVVVLGDVFADGICNVIDVVQTVDSILSRETPEKLEFHSADINKSGTLTASDVVKMRKMILDSVDYVGLSPETGMYSTSQYVAAAYDKPMWEGDIVYQETAVVTTNPDGGYNDIQLLYDIDEIIEVRNFALSKAYEQGKDYEVIDGKIRILDGTSIPAIADTSFIVSGTSGYVTTDGQHCLKGFGNGDGLIKYQISVTYTHSDTWEGFVPSNESSNLSGFYEKLENGEDVNMVFFGDSIAVGYHSSGCKEGETWKYLNATQSGTGSAIVVDRETAVNQYGQAAFDQIMLAPYAPNWPHAVHSRMQAAYPDAAINYINVSSGSTNSQSHGTTNLQRAVIEKNPDIVFIAFGTNEATNTSTFKSNHKKMIDGILAANPDCAIVLVSPTVPNMEAKGYANNKFDYFEDVFYELQDEYSNAQIAVVPVYEVAKVMMERKRYQDVSGNNINHPNDFGARVYSNSIMKVLGLYD